MVLCRSCSDLDCGAWEASAHLEDSDAAGIDGDQANDTATNSGTSSSVIGYAMLCKHRLPGFRATCLGVGIAYVLLGGSILARGGAASLADFAVPEATLSSPHYADAIWWVYTHMIVLGLVIGVVGQWGRDPKLGLWFSRLMVAAHAYYVVLDTRASDSPLGTGLYQGPGSIAPAVIGLVVMLLFVHLSLCRETERST